MNFRTKQGVEFGRAIGICVIVLCAIVGPVWQPAGIDASAITIAIQSAVPTPSPELSITLHGANPLELECGDLFEDPGATASNRSGESVEVQVSGNVDVTVLGSYTVTYTATHNGQSVSTERTVVVTDTTAPSVILHGSNPMALNCGEAFEDPGGLAIDACNREVPLTVSGTVDPNVPGTYSVTYSSTDSRGNASSLVRRVLVGNSEDAPPHITISGPLQMIIECGETFSDPGATASTACTGSVQVEPSGIVDTNKPGEYVISYKAVVGELTTEGARRVFIVDTKPPIISLHGETPMVLELNERFTDPGATARDGCAGSFPATASGTVDTRAVGSYTLQYDARDPSENEAISVTRIVKVVSKKSEEPFAFLQFQSLGKPVASLEFLFSYID